MTVQSDDGRLRLNLWGDDAVCVYHHGLLTAHQILEALLPLLPPPPPTARDVAEAVLGLRPPWDTSELTSVWDLARRWDEGGRP